MFVPLIGKKINKREKARLLPDFFSFIVN